MLSGDNGVGDPNAALLKERSHTGRITSKQQHPKQDKREIQETGKGQGRQQIIKGNKVTS